MLQKAFDDYTLSKTSDIECYKMFKESRELVKDKLCSCRPPILTNE